MSTSDSEQLLLKKDDTERVMIPRFKDKVMYVSAANSKTRTEASYVIASSFKGIVRLSPNNHNTTYEKPAIQLSVEDDQALGTTYTDAIKFDSEVENAIQTEAAIDKRMIIGSDSDGYLVNFRLSEDSVEFDNLGVIGVTEAKHLSIFTTSKIPDDDILLINGRRMPALPNSKAEEVIFYKEDGSVDTPIGGDEYYTKEVQITGIPSHDESYMLYSTVTPDNNVVYKYKKSVNFIREIILEALLDFQTIPTGSIHWFPVSIDQFKTLVNNNGKSPNVNFTSDTEDYKVCPLLRDFLLCDGRLYYNRDFPELAKILWKEKVPTWKIESEGDQNVLYPYEQNENERNNYGPKNEEVPLAKHYTFRVPDLRHQFLSSIYHTGSMTSVASGQAPSGKSPSSTNVGTGTWCVDKNSESSTNLIGDHHVHFVGYGSWGALLKDEDDKYMLDDNRNALNPSEYQISGHYDYTDDKSKDIDDTEDYPQVKNRHMFLLHNHPYKVKAEYYNKNIYGFEGFGKCHNIATRRKQSGSEAIPCTMWFSRPANLEDTHRNFIKVGKSSLNAIDISKPSGYSDIDDEFSNNTKWGDEYAAWIPDLYGHENSPKFYAMLPFIKI